MVTAHSEPPTPTDGEERLLTLPELADRVGLPARTIRFYASKGLIPPPVRQGRTAHYAADHVARLELVTELQSHGFTLAAIESYLARVPDDATPEDIALHRTLLAPWTPDAPQETLTHRELERRAGRSLSEEDLETLSTLGVITADGEQWLVTTAYLSLAISLVDLGFPPEAGEAVREIYVRHGRQIAEETTEVFRTRVWPAYRDAGTSPGTIQKVVERLKPLTVHGLVMAFEEAVNETKRAVISRRTHPD